MMSPAYSPQAQAITPSHYCDVVDERNIEHLCGYPPCGTRLGPVTAQRYHISLEKKQVYDLAERKVGNHTHCMHLLMLLPWQPIHRSSVACTVIRLQCSMQVSCPVNLCGFGPQGVCVVEGCTCVWSGCGV